MSSGGLDPAESVQRVLLIEAVHYVYAPHLTDVRHALDRSLGGKTLLPQMTSRGR